MRISQNDVLSITSAVRNGKTILAESILEKDVIVTRIIAHIANLSSPSASIIFCGGTCLSKAYAAICN